MAIDPRIAMGFQAPQIASPMDLAQNAFALKGAMQQNALAETKMAEMQRQQQSQNALRQLFAGGKMPDAAAVYAVDPTAGAEFEQRRAEIGRAQAAAAASDAERAGSLYKNDSAKFGDLLNLISGAKRNPSLYKINIALAKQRGFDVSQVPPEYDENWVTAAEQAVLSVKDRFDIEDRAAGREISQAQVDVSKGQLKVAERNADVNEAGEARLSAEATSDVVRPKLKPGERWNAAAGTVEAVPGSSEYIKQQGAHKKDYSTVASVQEQRKLADEKIAVLLDPKNDKAFNNIFGGFTEKYLTSKFSGPTATLQTELNSLKNNLKNAGLRLIQQGGKIGAITEREWPILEGMIADLDSKLDVEPAKNKLNQIKAYLARMEANAADEYETTWGNTQYYKPPKSGGGAAPTAKPKPIDDVMAQADAILAESKK
jgi:hypothetical protein